MRKQAEKRHCAKCGAALSNYITVDGRRRNISNRKYCLECSPFGKHNTREPGMDGKKGKACVVCGKSPINRHSVTCSPGCFQEKRYREHIARWKTGLTTAGTLETKYGQVSAYIRRYLREKYGDKCSRCGWHERHPITGLVPLQVEHINGNSVDFSEANLDLICPNCHSLTPTYGKLNAGNGRPTKHVRKGNEAA